MHADALEVLPAGHGERLAQHVAVALERPLDIQIGHMSKVGRLQIGQVVELFPQ